jgi:dTDP-glucose 4,6-dehydratase
VDADFIDALFAKHQFDGIAFTESVDRSITDPLAFVKTMLLVR